MKYLCPPSLARLLLAASLGSFFIIPSTAPNAEAVPVGATIYVFAGDDSGGRYAIKSNGDGTFSPNPITLTFTKGDNNRGGAVEDLDNDGDLDFFGANNVDDTYYWFKQGPAGTFVDQGTVLSGLALNGFEMGMAADDFNQDGKVDVLFSGNTDFFRVLSGNGAGGFSLATTIGIPSGFGVRGKDTGDINRDGYSDAIIALATSGELFVFYNNGVGGFVTPGSLALDTLGLSNDPHAVAVADFTGDGNLDIAAGGSSDGDVSLWTGDGNGVFTFSSLVFDFNGRTSIGNYDFDTDGDQDLLATTQADKKVRYLAGNGNGTFAAPVELGAMVNFGVGMATPPSPPIRSKVQGKVGSDVNANGVIEGTEGGVGGVSLSLTGTDYLGHSVSRSTVSAADGSYLFTDVLISNAAGYTLMNASPSGYSATTTTSRTVSVPRENTTVAENFGYLPHSQVTGKVWNDANGNGVLDSGEAGIAGVGLQLSDTDYQGATVLLPATTAADGTYVIGGLLLSGSMGGTLSVASPPLSFDATTVEFSNIVITTGGSTLTRNFGYKLVPNPGTISGKVFEDVNQSGFNESEPPIASLSVTLTGMNYKGQAVSESRTSDAAGGFSFTVLPSDNAGYLLSSATPTGALATCPVSTTIILGPEELAQNDFCFKFTPPPDPDDDGDGVLDANDLCPATVLPEGVPTEKLLKNHYANTDTDAFFETGPTHADSEFTMADTKGCSCEQILNSRKGKKKGHYKFGCPKGVIKKWVATCRNNVDDDNDGVKDKDDDDECEDDDD